MELPEIEWQPISRAEFYGWLIFYGVLLLYLARHFAEPTLLDNVHLPIHEGGHLFFSYFGETLHLWGGTLFQLLIPALLAVYFVSQRRLPGATFCVFAFFHSLTGVATYMSDAIVRELPLVSFGSRLVQHLHPTWCSVTRGADRFYNSFHRVVRIVRYSCVVLLEISAAEQRRRVTGSRDELMTES